MEIKKMRLGLNMTQETFSNRYGIPLGTLRNWEQGFTNPPEYVVKLLLRVVMYESAIEAFSEENMINIKTVKFMKMIEELTEYTNGEILPFSKATEENCDKRDVLFYDEKSEEYDEENHIRKYKLVSSYLVENFVGHHDIISTYDDYVEFHSREYEVRYVIDENDEPENKYIEINLPTDFEDSSIVIQDGNWYFC